MVNNIKVWRFIRQKKERNKKNTKLAYDVDLKKTLNYHVGDSLDLASQFDLLEAFIILLGDGD